MLILCLNLERGNLLKMYSRSSCVQCNSTKRFADHKGVELEVINLDDHPERLSEIEHLGYLQAPVLVAENDNWSGFRPDKLIEFASTN